MFQDLPGIAWLLACAALAPAAFIWWRSRTLTRLTSDPALPERLLAERQRNGRFVGVLFVMLLVLSYRDAFWTVPLLIVGTAAAGYPLRRALFEETWSLGGYLWFVVRLFVGVWGFWLLLALFPLLPSMADRFDWLVAAGIAALLLAWNAWYGDVLRRLLRARPLQDAALVNEFTRLAGMCHLPVPRFEQVDLGGGVIANAIALPALRRSSVVFTDALLSRLTPAESAAICAHELAHLEHFNPPLLKRINLVTHSMIALGAVLAVLHRIAGRDLDLLSTMIWAGTFLGVIVWRARDRQQQETICDQRAVALCGDVEVVVRALTKIHASARLPRRFDGELEKHASHPSLARRLRDIRAAAGASPIALESAATFSAADGTVVVTFAADRLQWSEGDVATYSLSYGHLSELRLNATVSGRASLVAVERSGRRWEVSVAGHDVGRLQSILDVVDTRLTNPATENIWPKLAKAVTAFAAVVALMIGQLAMGVVALVAYFHPRPPILAGTGVAALAAAVLSFRTDEAVLPEIQLVVPLLLALTGVVTLWGAYATRGEDLPKNARFALAALAICSTAVAGLLWMNGLDPVDLHQSALSMPAAAVFPLALSATLARWPARTARWASAPIAVLGLLAAAVGSTAFLDRFGDDPFLVPAEPVAWRTLDGKPQREFPLPFYATEIQLSPSGRTILASSVPDYTGGDPQPHFHVGHAGASLSRFDANEALFVDDDRLLTLDIHDGEADIREVRVDDPEQVVWHQRVQGIHEPVLSVDPARARWQLLGSDSEGGLVRAVAAIGSPQIERMHWARSSDPTRWPQTIAASGETALVMEMRHNPFPMSQGMLSIYLSLLRGYRFESHLTRVHSSGRSEVGSTKLWTQCVKSRADHERMTCHVFDGTRTRFMALDAATGEIRPLTWVTGRFAGSPGSTDGWLSGWLGSEAVAIGLITREGLRLAQSAGYRANLITMSGGTVATLAYDGRGSILRLYDHRTVTLRASGR